MKTIKDKQILVGADFAGYPLKEAVVAHLKEYGYPFRFRKRSEHVQIHLPRS